MKKLFETLILDKLCKMPFKHNLGRVKYLKTLKITRIVFKEYTAQCNVSATFFQEDFLKWKGSLFFRFVTTLVDEYKEIREFGEFDQKIQF